jgi:hypothetical protein
MDFGATRPTIREPLATDALECPFRAVIVVHTELDPV